MDHLSSHPTQDSDPYSDSLTDAYDDMGSWSFMNTANKDFNLTFTSFGGTNVPQEPIFLPDPLGLSSTLRVGVPPYESSKAGDRMTPEPSSASALDSALLSPFTASSRATPGTGPTNVHELPTMAQCNGLRRDTPGPSRSHSVMRPAPESAGLPALETLLVRVQNSPCPSTLVIRPPRDVVENLPILVHNVPRHGLTKRPESPFRLTLDLAQLRDELSSYDRIGSWNWLKLPAGSTTRQGKLTVPGDTTAAEDTLNLSVVVKCFSDPSIPVNPCQKCRDREEARVQRNLANRISRNNSTPDRSEDSLTNPPSSAIKGKSVARAQDAGGGSGIVVFNCAEYQCFRDGRVVLPLRVTCYSRHHNEKVGFQLTFSLADSRGRVIGRGSAGPILITDPHSNASARAKRAQSSAPMVPKPKKRRQREPSSISTEISDTGSTPMNDVQDANSADTSHIQSYPCSGNVDPSRAVQPNSSQHSSTPPSSSPASHITSDGDSAIDSAPNDPASSRDVPRPRISAVIPENGPTLGGIKITVLGQNFTPQNQCVFGKSICTWTTFWNEGALTCLLPSSTAPRRVIVSIHGFPISVGGGIPGTADGEDLQWFTYVDSGDVDLMKLALQVFGFAQSGHVEDPKDVAQRIINGVSTHGGAMAFSPELMGHLNACSESGIVSSANLETLVIELLGFTPADSPTVAIQEAISCCRISGRTILHMSAALGYHTLLDHVIRAGADLDTRDANGHTALHFTALYGRTQCTEVLVNGGADMEIVDAHGQGAIQLAFRSGHSTIGKLLSVYEDSGSEVEDTESHYEDDSLASESIIGDLRDIENNEQASRTDGHLAMTLNDAREVSSSSPNIGAHLIDTASGVGLENEGFHRQFADASDVSASDPIADAPRAPSRLSEHPLPHWNLARITFESEASPRSSEPHLHQWDDKHRETIFPPLLSPHPNDESSSLINFEPHDGVAPQSRFAPLGGATNHKSTSSLKVASVAAMDRPHDYDPLRKDGYRSPPTPDTPSNWKPMQCHPDSHNTETLYPAVAPDSMQYWTGMLGILLDGSSSPSVSITPSESSTLLDFSPNHTVICNDWNPEYSPSFSGASTPSRSPLSSSPESVLSAYPTDSLGLWLGRSKSLSFSSTASAEEQTAIAAQQAVYFTPDGGADKPGQLNAGVGATARSRGNSSASDPPVHPTPGAGESPGHPLSVLDSDPTIHGCRSPVGKHQYKAARFVCPVEGCGSTFTRASNLRCHLRSHREERPYVCKWPDCGKGFTRAHDCKRHESLHLGIRPFTCTSCAKTFARLDALDRHLASGDGCRRPASDRPSEPPPTEHLHKPEVIDVSTPTIKTEMT